MGGVTVLSAMEVNVTQHTSYFTSFRHGHFLLYVNWMTTISVFFFFFIGPESDHCLPLSLTHSCLVNLVSVTVACGDGNSKLVEVVTVVEVGVGKHVDNSLVQIWKINFGHKVEFLSGL